MGINIPEEVDLAISLCIRVYLLRGLSHLPCCCLICDHFRHSVSFSWILLYLLLSLTLPLLQPSTIPPTRHTHCHASQLLLLCCRCPSVLSLAGRSGAAINYAQGITECWRFPPSVVYVSVRQPDHCIECAYAYIPCHIMPIILYEHTSLLLISLMTA